MHQTVEPLRSPRDWWALHDSGYRRELFDPMVLAGYALSRSTARVEYAYATAVSPPELRAVGPANREVYYEVPRYPSEQLRVYLVCLGRRLDREGKLVKG